MIELIGRTALLLFGYASLLFLISVRVKRNDIADAGWGIAFIVVIGSCLWQYGLQPMPLIVYGMVTLWALRLTGHMVRRIKAGPEDFRYRQWREAWGKKFYIRSWLQVYLLQGFFAMIIAAPLLVIAPCNNKSIIITQAPGLVIWVAGWIIQAMADEQLHRFRKNRKEPNRILQTGLWRYSRHPNYFGEILMWWGLFGFVAPLPNGIGAIVSPVTITWLLRYVSGIPMLEKKYEGDPEFERYKKRTPALFPWFPKK